jgi:hypothetical protein
MNIISFNISIPIHNKKYKKILLKKTKMVIQNPKIVKLDWERLCTDPENRYDEIDALATAMNIDIYNNIAMKYKDIDTICSEIAVKVILYEKMKIPYA